MFNVVLPLGVQLWALGLSFRDVGSTVRVSAVPFKTIGALQGTITCGLEGL